MLKIDRSKQSFFQLESATLADASIMERYDLQEFISNGSIAFFKEIGEELFLVGKELTASKDVQDRIDLLAVDKEGTSVVIELKRGSHKLHMLQAISYAGMISHWTSDEFLALLDDEGQEALTNFLECDVDDINRRQRIILVAESYDYALLVGAEWLCEQFGVSISCCRISLAKDPATGSEYVFCSNVYPAPELAAEAASRGRVGKVNRELRWPDWETALVDISNEDVADYFRQQLTASRESYLRKRMLHYRIEGKRRWSVSARAKSAYVWQHGRFENDVEFWKRKVSNQESVKPVKDGKCLRLFLEKNQDLEAFDMAATKELQSVSWTSGITDEGIEDETE